MPVGGPLRSKAVFDLETSPTTEGDFQPIWYEPDAGCPARPIDEPVQVPPRLGSEGETFVVRV